MSNLLPESMLAEIRARAEAVPMEPPFSHGAFAIADRRKLLAHIEACSSGGASELQGRQWAVFCDTCGATWSVQHYHAGKDRCEKCRNSSPEPEDLRAEVERLRVERYLCVLAMRCAMGAHHDGVDAMRERLEPVVARYGIATACAARAAISDADAACIEAQYSRSEIAGSSGEPVAKPNPCRNECSLISLDDDHWKCNHCDAVFAYTGAQKPVEKPRCWWPLCKETAGDALCDAVQSALTKETKHGEG